MNRAGNGAQVSVSEAVYETYGSALELARGFGSAVLEPRWWPGDAGEITYTVDRFPGRASYRIGSTRHGGVPLFVIGRVEAAEARRSPRDWLVGEWHEPAELSHVQGLIGRVGVPPVLQAFVYDDDQTIVLVGYDTEAEIVNTVESLRRVRPE